jgi:hypothetical protein
MRSRTRLYPVRADLATLVRGTIQSFYLLAAPAGPPRDDELRV